MQKSCTKISPTFVQRYLQPFGRVSDLYGKESYRMACKMATNAKKYSHTGFGSGQRAHHEEAGLKEATLKNNTAHQKTWSFSANAR